MRIFIRGSADLNTTLIIADLDTRRITADSNTRATIADLNTRPTPALSGFVQPCPALYGKAVQRRHRVRTWSRAQDVMLKTWTTTRGAAASAKFHGRLLKAYANEPKKRLNRPHGRFMNPLQRSSTMPMASNGRTVLPMCLRTYILGYIDNSTSSIESTDLFLVKKGEDTETVKHSWEMLRTNCRGVMFDPSKPDDPNRYLALDFKSATNTFSLACAHCLTSISHEWPGKMILDPATNINKWTAWRDIDFRLRKDRGTGRPRNDGETSSHPRRNKDNRSVGAPTVSLDSRQTKWMGDQ